MINKNSNLEKRVIEIVKILRQIYPDPKTVLEYKTAWELLVATILAAQCTDERVNKITPSLFKKYPDISDFADAKQAELEQDVRSAGFFRNKAKNIIGAAQKIIKDFAGQVPDSMEQLITLSGVARKTANIVLSSVFKKAEGIAVDTHVRRLSQRLGLSKHTDPDKIEQDLMKIVPRHDWLDFNYLFVNHGRAICQARKPKCSDCMLNRLCPSAIL